MKRNEINNPSSSKHNSQHLYPSKITKTERYVHPISFIPYHERIKKIHTTPRSSPPRLIPSTANRTAFRLHPLEALTSLHIRGRIDGIGQYLANNVKFIVVVVESNATIVPFFFSFCLRHRIHSLFSLFLIPQCDIERSRERENKAVRL